MRANPTLSEDLISEILIRVPVKSLICFQLVSKSWLSLIKDPAFLKSQLLHAVKPLTQTQTLILSCYMDRKPTKFLLLANSRQTGDDLLSPYSRDEFKSVPSASLVGSANGIVCVVVVDISKNKPRFYLWNPATRRSKVIPWHGVCDYRGVEDYGLGFGYDQIDQDFKVVRVIKFELPPFLCAEVYSENHKAWRKMPDPIDTPTSNRFDVCFNGFLVGIGEQGMMAFDLNKEVLNCAIKLPVVYDDDCDDAHIIEFNNSCAVITIFYDFNYSIVDERIGLWTLNDDACLRCGGGVEASWTPIFSIHTDLPPCLDKITPGSTTAGYISNGDRVLLIMNNKCWISYNVDKNEAEIVPLSGDMADRYASHVYKYTESLISLAGFNQVNWNVSKDDN
ncbi:F-box domain-containing protein [Heracleum sosnowskyi]|uniref:F-box domain-containing protein n=1 Tax=Heracleum sosnowskyi TaxID=360622 RepID=A0AAD8J9H4_9APIA|nr:F-box domain-containing protein [Heracleum sosnowskyi]KAK1400400.1 F-box domain-containing protein [Heracleum sosnowskyi]KAK1400407.1 F-box domain-containing protein [Heracleum sosnowskyi]